MKTKKLSYPRSRRILILLCIGGLAIVGFTQVFGQYSISQLQQQPFNLQVPVWRQFNSSSCGEAVIAMTYNYAYPDTPITEGEVIDFAAVNGFYTPGVAPYTSPANMVKIAENYGDNISTGTVINSGQGLALLMQKLRNGEPVIIDVLSDFSDPTSVAHFVIVTGLSVDPSRGNAIVVHYNDPFTGTKESADWVGSEGFWNAWQTNGDPGGAGWWLVIPPP
jgi:hypothetical protein